MTADVYPRDRDSCIAPDIHSMDHEYKLLGKLLGHTPFKVYVYNVQRTRLETSGLGIILGFAQNPRRLISDSV